MRGMSADWSIIQISFVDDIGKGKILFLKYVHIFLYLPISIPILTQCTQFPRRDQEVGDRVASSHVFLTYHFNVIEIIRTRSIHLCFPFTFKSGKKGYTDIGYERT